MQLWTGGNSKLSDLYARDSMRPDLCNSYLYLKVYVGHFASILAALALGYPLATNKVISKAIGPIVLIVACITGIMMR